MSKMDKPTDDEISLLDLLLIIAQNWLLLILGPALIGAITFGVFVTQPQTYRWEATIGLPVPIVEALIAELDEDGTLDPRLGISSTGADGLSVTQGGNAQSSRLILRHLDTGAGTALGSLVATLATNAQALPLPDSHGALVDRVEALRSAQTFRDGVIARLEAGIADISATEPFDAQGYAAAALALDQVLVSRTAAALELDSLEIELVTASSLEIAAGPVAGPTREGRSPALMAAIAVLGSGFLILVLVFIRAGLRGASRDPETQEKLDAIKNAILLRRSKGV